MRAPTTMRTASTSTFPDPGQDAPDKNTPDEHTILPDLSLLDALFEREGMARSPDVWLNIHRLLLSRAAAAQIPDNPQDLANLIGPLVCKNPQHQQRILPIVREWLSGERPAVEASVSTPEYAAVISWTKRLRDFKRRSIFGWLLLVLLVFGAAFSIAYRPQDPEISLPTEIDKSPPPSDSTVKLDDSVPITDRVAPNPLPESERLPANWQRNEEILGWIVPALPLVICILWLIWRYRGRTVLRNQAPEGEKLLTHVNFKLGKDTALAPFSGPESGKALRRLLHPRWIESGRLAIEKSVSATARQFGFFTPCYRQRHIYPDYLVLVQSRHGMDQAAAFAETLVHAIRERRVNCRSYRFRDDPRRLIPWIQPADGADRRPLSLAQLGQRHGDARLIVISDWDILFLPYHPEQPQKWVEDFKHWERRVWLSAGFEDEQSACRAVRQAETLDFRLLPFDSHSISEWVEWLLQEGSKPSPKGNTGDDYLPAILGETSETWLDWRPPHGVDLKRLDEELRDYLGAGGFLLLKALAVFPKPFWPLPHVLDIQLFSGFPRQKPRKRGLFWPWKRKPQPEGSRPAERDTQLRLDREARLRRISRLPWSRHAFMPDYLRERLLKRIGRGDRQRIRDAWAALLERLSAGEDLDAIGLPIAVPKSNKLHLKNLFESAPEHSALNDPIFANILLGGKLGLLDFELPRMIARVVPETLRRLDLRPALIALVLTAASIWGLNAAWQMQVKAFLFTFWQQRIERENQDWQVTVQSGAATRDLARTLSKRLEDAGFRVEEVAEVKPANLEINHIEYPANGRAPAERLAQKLVWLSYGAEVELNESANAKDNSLRVQLAKAYQPGAVFHDASSEPYQSIYVGKKAKPAVPPIEPEMVEIKPGRFRMGSPSDEAGRYDDEGPQHEVTIAYPFEIGKFEVTFDEYARFAEATGRTTPNDEGREGNKRPKVIVSWFDALAYTRWLSQQTGKNYRLPTEAEWEYAARAGTTSPYFWGDESRIGEYAWYAGNSGSKTHPVGEKKPNAFGLYDTSGNVFEWTQDCWHASYDQAPNDGSAWLEGDGGDCDRRVVRGGSWDVNPRVLRSASRGGIDSVEAYYSVGFRVARAL